MLRSERYFGASTAASRCRVELDETTSSAKFDKGVLELTLAKKPAATARKLTIQ